MAAIFSDDLCRFLKKCGFWEYYICKRTAVQAEQNYETEI